MGATTALALRHVGDTQNRYLLLMATALAQSTSHFEQERPNLAGAHHFGPAITKG